MRVVLKEQYENRYSAVGREIISTTFLIIFAVLIVALIAVMVYVFFFKSDSVVFSR